MVMLLQNRRFVLPYGNITIYGYVTIYGSVTIYGNTAVDVLQYMITVTIYGNTSKGCTVCPTELTRSVKKTFVSMTQDGGRTPGFYKT